MRALRTFAAGLALAGLATAPLAAQIYVWRPGVGGFSTALSPAHVSVGYDQASIDYFAAIPAGHQPDAAHKALIDTAIRCTKNGGGWSKIDWLLVPSVDLTASLVNVANPAKSASVVGTVTVTPYQVFAPDGSTGYLDFGEAFNASTNHFGQDDATIGTWFNGGTPDATTGYGISSTDAFPVTLLRRNSTTGVFAALNVSAGTTVTVVAGPRDTIAVRRDSSITYFYVDGTRQVLTQSRTSIAPNGHAGAFTAYINKANVFSAMQASLLLSGSAFTDSEVTQFDSCWRTYLQATGAIS